MNNSNMLAKMPAFLAIALASCATPGAVSDTPETRLLAEMRAACGGDAWDTVRGWHESGTVDVAGRTGLPYESWSDMNTLKTANRVLAGGQVMRHVGFDGSAYWQVTPDGAAQFDRDPEHVQRQRRDAYISSFGFFFPDRFPARFVLMETAGLNGRVHDVLRVTPADAAPVDLWVDRETRRISRFEADGERADLGDYRMFNGVCTATTGRQGDGNVANEIVLHVEQVDIAPVAADTFTPPSR